jgi:hypothetical protein
MTDHGPPCDEPIVLPTGRLRLDPDPELDRLPSTCPHRGLLYSDGAVGWLGTSFSAGQAISPTGDAPSSRRGCRSGSAGRLTILFGKSAVRTP